MQTRIEELVAKSKLAPSGEALLNKCLDLAEMLIEKNISYANSALDPVRIFSTASTEEQILVRCDDKLNRIRNGSEYKDEDSVRDLAGYLVLLLVNREINA